MKNLLKAVKQRPSFYWSAAQEPVAIRAVVIVLGIVVLFCAGLLLLPLRSAVVASWQSPPANARCETHADDAARLSCYDQPHARAVRHPAKGANAPLFRQPDNPSD